MLEILGDGQPVIGMIIASLNYSYKFYKINEPNPEPEPPQTECMTLNPHNLSHFSASFRIESSTFYLVAIPAL